MAPPVRTGIPYLGVRPFDEPDERLFFGRETQVNATLRKLEDHHFLAVVGSSGCGKSSFVRAGLIPVIRQGFLDGTTDWRILIVKPGQDPYASLARQLEQALLKDPEKRRARQRGTITYDDLLEVLCASDDGVAETLARLDVPASTSIFLVVDQFEELFAFRREQGRRDDVIVRDRAGAFVRALLAAANDSRRSCRVVLTLRSDFIGEADAFLGLPEAISNSQLLVPRLTRRQMEEAIVRPATVSEAGFAPFTFEEHLVNRIINDAGDRPDQLPLMQHALMRTWKRAVERTRGAGEVQLTHDDYQKVGTISRALSLHADEAWREVAGSERPARITRQLFLLLCDITQDGKVVRRRPPLSEVMLATGASVEEIVAVVRAFQADDRNFLTPPVEQGLGPDDVLDISHESLIRQWTQFKGWISDRAAGAVAASQLRETAETRQVVRASAGELRITVVNGDLTFASGPLLVGHYTSSRLTGSEAVANASIGGAMAAALRRGLYPDSPGSHQVFASRSRVATFEPDRPPPLEAVIVVGLGQEGRLRHADLVASVRQSAIAWAQRLSESSAAGRESFEITATLIGSGGAGVGVSQSAQLLAQAVHQANELLAEQTTRDRRWPTIRHLQIVELYHDRAVEAWRALNVQAAAVPGQFTISGVVQSGAGGLRHSMELGYRGVEYDFLSATTASDGRDGASIAYALDTRLARSQVRGQTANQRLLQNLVSQSSSGDADPRLGRTLFKLLVPVEIEPFLASTQEVRLELDPGTASIPWELIESDAGGTERRPWAIRCKLLRVLRTAPPRMQVADASAGSDVLVIGDPASDATDVNRRAHFPGAREEAWAVSEQLRQAAPDGTVVGLFSSDTAQDGPDAKTVIAALFERNWRILHLVGDGGDGGLLLSHGARLGPAEIQSMRIVPELVFVNCGHQRAMTASPSTEFDEGTTNWPRFAASVGASLLAAGVRCVVAAGWVVDDVAAREFASRFYGALTRGRRFIDAVAEAREAAFSLGGHTWAAYQCYGDADWRFRQESADAAVPATGPRDGRVSIASTIELKGALETIAVRSRYQHADRKAQEEGLIDLERLFADTLGKDGGIAESFADAWAAIGELDRATRWYQRALDASDGHASLKAFESLANAQIRLAWQDYGAGKASREYARQQIAHAVKEIERVLMGRPTFQRERLMGAAYKKLALIDRAEGANGKQALMAMRRHYDWAARIGRDLHRINDLLNVIAAELVLRGGDKKWKGLAPDLLDDATQLAHAAATSSPNLWSIADQLELQAYEAIGARRLAAAGSPLMTALRKLHQRAPSPAWWVSLRDHWGFVVADYAQRTTGAEQKAALAILKLLDQLAGIKAEPARAPRGGPRRRRPKR